MGRRRKDERPLPPWAALIKRARLSRGFKTQAALAQAIGYSQQRVADWEAGRARPPRARSSTPDRSARGCPNRGRDPRRGRAPGHRSGDVPHAPSAARAPGRDPRAGRPRPARAHAPARRGRGPRPR
ncbi:MAG: helix-turn-helix transcriptional regulator [Myxococcales bacterium]